MVRGVVELQRETPPKWEASARRCYLRGSTPTLYPRRALVNSLMSAGLWRMSVVQMERVAVYIDGFNMYYGLRDAGWRRYYWLDFRRLSEKLLRFDQRLVRVSYFTARVSSTPGDPDKPKRQGTYLEALATLSDLHIYEGYHSVKQIRCSRCGAMFQSREEKMTDVNIAVEMLGDAQDDVFDTAILISADSDLTRPVEAVRSRYPKKRVIVALPPRRNSVRLRNSATAAFTIGRRLLSSSQLPEHVTKADGHVLTRPHQWR